jgi:ABC-type transporter Mla MlaB component
VGRASRTSDLSQPYRPSTEVPILIRSLIDRDSARAYLVRMKSASGAWSAVPVRRGEQACSRVVDPVDRERLSVAFIREGLRRGDKVVYICDHEDVDVVVGRLETLDPGLGSTMAREQFRPAREAYIPAGSFDPNRMVGLVRRDYESVDVSPELAAIGRRGELEAARDWSCGALRLSGELDFRCASTVSEVLEKHFDGPLRLDLADLSFVDVAGLRALGAGRCQRVTIARASAAVRQMPELLAWDADPNIEFLEAA